MIGRLKVLLRGDADRVAESVSRAGSESVAQFSLIILIGAGLYGATLGLWRGPLQAFYTAIKFPLVIFLTCLGNGAINGMLAQILGSGSVVQANGGRDPDELRNCGDNSGGFRAAHAFCVV